MSDVTRSKPGDARRTPPVSPIFSNELVNPNVFAGVGSEPPRSPVVKLNEAMMTGLAKSIAECSPRSASSDDSALLTNFDSALGDSSGMNNDACCSTVSDSQETQQPSGHRQSSRNSSAMHSRGASTDDDQDITVDADGMDLSGLPSALMVANLPDSLFRDEAVKAEFESMYLSVDAKVKFGYFKFFRRARLAFSSSLVATRVRLLSHGSTFHGKTIKVYFHETPFISIGPRQLEIPEVDKQFLISPPASPPVGWEQNLEHSPIGGAISAGVLTPSVMPQGGHINEDVAKAVKKKLVMKQSPAANITGVELMAALAKLVPGEQTEILSPGPDNPGIVIETCEDRPADRDGGKIKQTRCPERKN